MNRVRTTKKKRKITLALCGLIGITVYLLVLFINQQMRMHELQQKLNAVQAEIEQEEMRKMKLQEQIEQLSSLDYVEKAAREELGLLKEGETPYITITPDQD